MSCMNHVSAAIDSVEVLSLTTASSTFVRTSATLLQPLPQIFPISGTLFPTPLLNLPTHLKIYSQTWLPAQELRIGCAAHLKRMTPLPRPHVQLPGTDALVPSQNTEHCRQLIQFRALTDAYTPGSMLVTRSDGQATTS